MDLYIIQVILYLIFSVGCFIFGFKIAKFFYTEPGKSLYQKWKKKFRENSGKY